MVKKIDYRVKLFDVVRQAILLIDRDYRIVDANNAACDLLNLTRDRVVGEACFKASHKLDRPCWNEADICCPVRSAFEFKAQTSVIHRHVHAGKVTLEEVVASPILDDQGEVLLVVEELTDVTELMQTQEISEHLRSEIKTLRGIIPICASCKNIRDDKGYWQQVEGYIRERTQADFTHSYCPECVEKALQQVSALKNRKKT